MSVTVGPLQDATVHAATATKNATVTAALVTKDVTVHATMATKEATVNAASSTSKGVSSGLSSVVLKAKMASRDQDLLFCKALFNFYIYVYLGKAPCIITVALCAEMYRHIDIFLR
jgi:hypothetical protein